MTIQPLRFMNLSSAVTDFAATVKDKASEVFEKIKDVLPFQKNVAADAASSFNFRSLATNPGAVVEGAMWAGFWGMSAWFLADSITELYTTFTLENTDALKFEKIGSAVKTAMIDLLSLFSSTAYMARWADEAQVITLGQYVPFVKNLCFGTSLAINGIETGAGIYNIWVEKEAIINEVSPLEREKHKQLLCHGVIKLIGSVSMVAWAALGIAALVGGLAVSPILTTVLLGSGFFFGVTAIFYKMHLTEIEKASKLTVATSSTAG